MCGCMLLYRLCISYVVMGKDVRSKEATVMGHVSVCDVSEVETWQNMANKYAAKLSVAVPSINNQQWNGRTASFSASSATAQPAS